jgi:hypothetical protein
VLHGCMSVKHVLFDHMQLIPPLLHSCRYNNVGAAGAKKLVKADWPELRMRNILCCVLA